MSGTQPMRSGHFHILDTVLSVSSSEQTWQIIHHPLSNMASDPNPNLTQILASDVILEDDVVQLRTLTRADFPHLLPFAPTEPEIWKYSLIRITNEAELGQYLEQAMTARVNGSEHPFIVYDKLKRSYAGSTRFYDIQPLYSSLQLGYTWYGTAFQGTNLNKHCKHLLLGYAFETLGMERVEFRADNDNARSIAAMKRIGCTVEGVLRSHLPLPDGGRRNTIVLSILKDEWFGHVKERLAEQF